MGLLLDVLYLNRSRYLRDDVTLGEVASREDFDLVRTESILSLPVQMTILFLYALTFSIFNVFLTKSSIFL